MASIGAQGLTTAFPANAKIAGLLADKVTVARLVFRQALDSLLADFDDPELPRSFMHAITLAMRIGDDAAPLDPALDRDAFALTFLAIRKERAFFSIAMALAALGAFDLAGATAADQAKSRLELREHLLVLLGLQSVAPQQPVAQPHDFVHQAEAITDPNGVWIDPIRLSSVSILACRRVCRVASTQNNGKASTGTGFLVGPSAVMTNWHVVADLIELFADGELDTNLLSFSFDNLRGNERNATKVLPRRTDWLLASSRMGALSPKDKDKSVGWWMDQNERLNWLAGLGDSLDFAVIALESAPGEQRGWYDLSVVDGHDKVGSCQVFHHPSGQGLSFSSGSISFPPPLSNGYRMFHTANTIGGSSGGLLVNWLGQPIGLHHAGYGYEGAKRATRTPKIPDEVVNAAVPLAAIARKIGTDTLRQITKSVSLAAANGCIDGKQPLFGRHDLLTALEELSSAKQPGPQKQVLWIKPPVDGALKKPGKSFSVAVMKALLPAHIYVEITADMVKADGRSMAELLLKRIAPQRQVNWPEPATTEQAYFESELLTKLFEEIRLAALDRQVWIVIDDLDTMNLPETGGRRFLDAVYSKVSACSTLRIVLIGLKTAVPSIPNEQLRAHQIEIGDVGKLFQDWLSAAGERNRPIDAGVKLLLSQAMSSYAGSDQPLERLSDFTRQHLVGPLSAFFNESSPP